MSLHPLQKCVNKRQLMEALEKVAVEVVNLVGIDISQLGVSENLANQLQFLCGLGPRKAFSLLEKLEPKKLALRSNLLNFLSGKYVHQNCSPFFKV